jgi:hypothetical protein
MKTLTSVNSYHSGQETIKKELLARRDLQIATMIRENVSGPLSIEDLETEGVVGKGSQIPLETLVLPDKQVDHFIEAGERVLELDWALKSLVCDLAYRRKGEDIYQLLSYIMDIRRVDDPGLFALVDAYIYSPTLCLQGTHSYRGDGRYIKGKIPGFNEVNSSPGGVHCVSEYAKATDNEESSYGAQKLVEDIVERIAESAIDGIVYLPTDSIHQYKLVQEAMSIMRKLEEKGVKALFGEVSALKVNADGDVVAEHDGNTYRVAYLDGVSTPTTIWNRPDLIKTIARKKMRYPSIGDIVGITNKGTYALITAIKEGRLPNELKAMGKLYRERGKSHIPATYRLGDVRFDQEIRSKVEALISSGKAVIKPIDGAGGEGIVLNPSVEDIGRLLRWREDEGLLVQEKMDDVVVDADGALYHGSLDPYLVKQGNSKWDKVPTLVRGVIFRGSRNGGLNTASRGDGKGNNIVGVLRRA